MKLNWAQIKTLIDTLDPYTLYVDDGLFYHIRIFDNTVKLAECCLDKTVNVDEVTEFETSYKTLANQPIRDRLKPFAYPEYAVVQNAKDSLVSCSVNSTQTIDFEIETECVVFGGEMLVKNAEFGDYFSAEVRDIDGVIPEAYRAALCEAWPVVRTYIPKRFIDTRSTIGYANVDSRPLGATVTAGLHMRITYNAVNAGSQREIALTYFLAEPEN